MSKRNDPNRKRVKEYLFNRYSSICMVCEKKFERNELQLHHLKKWEDTHLTTIEQGSLVCDCCHKNINYQERNNKKEYYILNRQIRNYKATH